LPTRVVAVPGGVAYSQSFPGDRGIVILMDDEEEPRKTGLLGVPFCHDGERLWSWTERDMFYPNLTSALLRDGLAVDVKKYRPKVTRPVIVSEIDGAAEAVGGVWISYQGLWRFDKKQETFSAVVTAPGWIPGADSRQISSTCMRQLRVRDDTLWIVTGRIYKYKLGSPTYEMVFESDPLLKKGLFGFEFTGKGFVLLDRNQPATAKGVGTNQCFAICVDADYLWCSPRAATIEMAPNKFTLGISRCDMADGNWKTFPSEEVGLPRHGPGLICTAIEKVGSEIWFGYKGIGWGRQGLVIAHDPSSGKWRQPIRGRSVYSIAVSDAYVYLGVEGGVMRVRRPGK